MPVGDSAPGLPGAGPLGSRVLRGPGDTPGAASSPTLVTAARFNGSPLKYFRFCLETQQEGMYGKYPEPSQP
eukprot:205861-Hanusia_phi.AAC.1